MKITIDKERRTPIYMQIVDCIKNMTIKGELPHGYVLPSERELAKTLDVHRNTVSKSYKVLRELDLIRSEQGISHKISYDLHHIDDSQGQSLQWNKVIKPEYIDMELEFDRLFSKAYEKGQISFAGGIAARDVYSGEEIAASIAEIMDEQKNQLFYLSPYQGDPRLIEMVSRFLMNKGIWGDQFNIQILSEFNQAADFLFAMMVEKGDIVITSELCSPDVHRSLALAGAEIVTVPEDKDGMVVDNLEPLIQKCNPKFLYLNGGYSNPTGSAMSFRRKKKLLELSYKYGFPIIEDDDNSELNYEKTKSQTLKSMDIKESVIYVHSFDLTFVPGLGIAAVIGPKEIIKGLSYLVSVRLVGVDWMAQKLLAKGLKSGQFYHKLEEYKFCYKGKRDAMCMYLDSLKELGVTYFKPKGGVYVWVEFPEKISVTKLYKMAEERGVSIVPGYVFIPDKGKKNNCIRLNFSLPSHDEIREGMEILNNLAKDIYNESAC